MHVFRMQGIKLTATFLYIIVINNILFVKTAEMNGHAFHSQHLDNLIYKDQHFLKSLEIVSKIRCTQVCAQTVECVSFFYNHSQKKCRLHSTGFYNAEDGTREPHWTYYVFGETWCPVHNGFVHERVYNQCIHFTVKSFNGYDSAKAYCLEKNAAILTLNTATKANQFATIIKKVNADYLKSNSPNLVGYAFSAYIGLRRISRTWKWEDESDLGAEEKWGTGQPFCLLGDCECAAICRDLISNWEWNAVKCGQSFAVVCEYI